MKIAFVTQEYYPSSCGGAGITSRLLVNALRKEGLEVHVFVPGAEIKQLPDEKLFYFHKSNRENLLTINLDVIRGLHRKLAKYDLIHVYNVVQLPGVLLIRGDVPVVATLCLDIPLKEKISARLRHY